MRAGFTWPPGLARLTGLVAATAMGLGTALLGANPAMAATMPTLTGPVSVNGWTWATMTGTARAGATVTLWEAAYVYRDDMAPAAQYFAEDVVQTVADSTGHFTLKRRLDSGFRFEAEADGLRSLPLDVGIVPIPHFTEFSTAGTNVTVSIESEPSQAWLPVVVQRQNGSAWTAVAQGFTAEGGVYSTVLTGESGTQTYRAEVGPEADNRVLVGHSVAVTLTVGGSGTPTITPTTPTTTPTTPTTKPPTIKPPTTKPPTPAPPATIQPKAGEVRFSLVQYDPPGSDTASKLNQEYVRITNYTTKTFNLKYWTVKDRAGNTYRFSGDFYLRGYKNLYISTGRGTNAKPSNYRYWGKTSFVWNNGGDAAFLRTGSNKLIDSCSWGDGSGKTSC